jgi:hypothetical protein
MPELIANREIEHPDTDRCSLLPNVRHSVNPSAFVTRRFFNNDLGFILSQPECDSGAQGEEMDCFIKLRRTTGEPLVKLLSMKHGHRNFLKWHIRRMTNVAKIARVS